MAETGTAESSIASIPSLSTKSPYTWTVAEVCGWLHSLKYDVEAKKFETATIQIDGQKLFTLDRTVLQNEVQIFDAAARTGILNAIDELKKRYKKLKRDKVEKFAATHTRKEKKPKNGGDEDGKNNDATLIEDAVNLRTYSLIAKNENTSEIGANYTIENILAHYDWRETADARLIDADNVSQYTLQHCALNGDKKKTVFMFMIYDTGNERFLYLFTKNLEKWTVENVFEFVRTISNKIFILFADELKRKKIDGAKLCKYNRQKLQTDFGNFFDSALRKKFLDELTVLKKQISDLNGDQKSDKDRGPKTFHNAHQRTKSDIEREREKRQKMRKPGPRDIGTIKYKGTKYDQSKDKAFLEDTIHPLSKDEKFQKRKEEKPADKKATVSEIGHVKGFKGVEYDDSSDAGFLSDRIHALSKDERFQKRKEEKPADKKATVSEIGKAQGFRGIDYDDSNDAGFLADRIHTLSKDERFQKRKEENPADKKATVSEIGHVKGFKGVEYDDSSDAGFLSDRIHALSKDERFQKRKEEKPADKKATVSEIGKAQGFRGIDYDDSNDAGFLADRIHTLSKDERFQKRKEENPADKKATVSEIGHVKGFKGAEYDDSSDAGFLSDRMHALSKDERFQKRKEDKPLDKKATVSEIGKVHGFSGIDYDDSKDAGFLADRIHALSKDERFQKRKEEKPADKKATVSEIGKAKDFKSPEWSLGDVVSGDGFLSDNAYYRYRTALVTNADGTVQQKLGPTEIGKVKGFNAIDYELTEDDLHGFLKEKQWYDSSMVRDEFDDGISHLLKSLPAHKLRAMDNAPLPTGYATKIVWLKRLRDLIEDEMKEEQEKEQQQQPQRQPENVDVEPVNDNGQADAKDQKLIQQRITSKIWLKRLRDLIEDEMKEEQQKEQQQQPQRQPENVDVEPVNDNGQADAKDQQLIQQRITSKMRKQQLDHLNAMLSQLEQNAAEQLKTPKKKNKQK
eukprot:CAMPEP_0202730070 /NCGR_PEP_ID=MMETSP1385-20130828/186454_1 /ASSEMBLY_ACC=CAM_ASM_000861 /TAXON_ID=933848 /ORGANISM="Elphidium margaritaceum" /LENGTH=967 /DNA_ID=CAMNT_0049396343 /DNA_START=41 /DNA_END=2944 /DNA_ORIENTATION=+